MKKYLWVFSLFFELTCISFGQNLDISGYKVIQANASFTITLPAGTVVEPGGYVIIARNQTKSAFETFWNVTLGSNVVFINGTTVIGGSGFPTINGSENYTLQNASGVTLDGPTVSEPTSGGDNLKRVNASAAAGVEASWVRSSSSTITNATPGFGTPNTNTGKLIISEISDASAYVNEFVELFYDATPVAKGQGSVILGPSQWKYNASAQLQFVFKPQTDTIHGLQFVKPAPFTWNPATITVIPDTATITLSGDTTTITNFALMGSDSIVVSISNVTTSDTTDEFTFNFKSSNDGIAFLSLSIQPKMLVYGSPRPMSWVKAKDGGGTLLYTGKWVVVQGIVTVANEFSIPSYMQDATAGIAVYDNNVSQNVTRGDEIVVLGMVSPYSGMFELNPCSLLQTISQGNDVDTLVLTIAQIKGQPQNGVEPYECKLVRVSNITSVLTLNGSPATSWTTTGSGTDYELVSGIDTLDVRISSKINLANTAVPSSKFDVVGVLGQYYTYYEIWPRTYDDIIVEGTGPRIISGPPYESNITSTNLTFIWQTDLPGTSIVNYGTTVAYIDSVIDTNAVTQHQITVNGLVPASIYHVRFGSTNSKGTTYTNDYLVSTASQSSSGTMNVYFNYPVNTALARGENAQTVSIVSKLVNRINTATYSVDVCMYNLSGTVGGSVASALVAAKNRGVKVRVIGEVDNSGNAPWSTLSDNGIPVIFDSYDATNAGVGIMHNKFFIIDNRDSTSDTDDWVWTGSWNATDPGNNNDAQNVIEIQDKALANAYTVEFNEMWGSNTDTPNATTSRFGAHKLDNTPHSFIIKEIPVELYFSPSDGTTSKIIKTLNKATSSIDIAMLTFTRNDIANVLIAKKKGGLKEHGVMDNRTDQGSVFDTLVAAGVDMHLKGSAITGLFHHKYAVVDGETNNLQQYVITGSHNWSSAAENSNNENTLIINSQRIANLYLQEFASRYAEAGGTDVLLGVEQIGGALPTTYGLSQNYPNPFNPTTNFQFQIPTAGFVSIKVYDILGREIATLVQEVKPVGTYEVTWNATALPSGVYFYRMQTHQTNSRQAGTITFIKRMVLIK